MKITSVEAFHIGLPYEHGAPKPMLPTGKLREFMDGVYVKVETDEGVTGWGEAFGFGACSVSAAAVGLIIAPLAVGRDPTDDAQMEDLRHRTHNMSLNGPVRYALSGFEIALWDIKGKIAGAPIWKLLGGDGTRKKLRTYASLIRVVNPIHVGALCERVAARGYKDIKLHEFTVEAVAASRAAAGPDINIMLDANCYWRSEQDALSIARKFLPYNLTWLEEPISPPDDFAALARIRKACGIKIASGENLGTLKEMERMLQAGAVDFVQPDVTKFGGIADMMKGAAMAERFGVTFEPHSPIHGPGLVATLHVLAAMKSHAMAELYYCDLAATPMGASIAVKDGFMDVPDGPGLGVEIDEALVRRYRL